MRFTILLIGYLFSASLSFGETTFADSPENAVFPDSICKLKNGQHARLNKSHYVQIGGINQWVKIKGENCSNPVVLLVHGGPGNPLSLYHDSLFKNWEKDFTVVHWDQRGSGKTYAENQEVAALTVERLNKTELNADLLIRDGLEVADYIRHKLGKEKIVLSGTSWGSFLAVKMAMQAPEKFHFYVGVSQIVNYATNMQESYRLVKSKALAKKDQAAIDVLQSIGPPPWTNPKSFGALRRIIRRYENAVVSKLPALTVEKEYASDQLRAAYFAGEEFSFVKFVGLNGDGMAQKISLDACCTELGLPVFLIQGADDLLTTAKVTEGFYNKIKAPEKKYIKLTQSGHDPNIEMLDRHLAVLKMGMMRAKGK